MICAHSIVLRLTRGIVLAASFAAGLVAIPSTSQAQDATCKSGFVWRVARPTALVCVTPESRARVAQEPQSHPVARALDGESPRRQGGERPGGEPFVVRTGDHAQGHRLARGHTPRGTDAQMVAQGRLHGGAPQLRPRGDIQQLCSHYQRFAPLDHPSREYRAHA